jgi:competence protein ComEC
MIGAPPSAIRAGLMLSLALLAVLLQRPSAALPMIAAAGLFLLALDPRAILDPGFQLSFAGVGGIILVLHLVGNPLVPRAWKRIRSVRWLGVESRSRFRRRIRRDRSNYRASLRHHRANRDRRQHTCPPADEPRAGRGSVRDSAATAAPAARSSLRRWRGASPSTCSIESLPSRPPFPSARRGKPARLAALVGGGCRGHSGLISRSPYPSPDPPRSHHRRCGRAANRLACPRTRHDRLTRAPLPRRGAGRCHGDPHPEGPMASRRRGTVERAYDAGARRVVPFLRARGANALELLILTHPHLDHIGGAPAVIRGLPVRTSSSRVTRSAPPHTSIFSTPSRKPEPSGSRGAAGDPSPWMGWSWTFSGPTRKRLTGSPMRTRLAWWSGSGSVSSSHLLTGDAGAEVEHLLVARHPGALRAQVLKAGHHGSSTSTSAGFLAAVEPQLVIVSAARRNRYGHPSPSVMRRLEEAGIEIARTDRDGTVSLRVHPEETSRWVRISR